MYPIFSMIWGLWINRGHNRQRWVQAMVVLEDRYTQWAKGLGRRQGIGEFVDAGGVMPRLFGRLQYLAAMALELKRERPLVQLVDIWSPCVEAMLALEQEMKKTRRDAEGTVPA